MDAPLSGKQKREHMKFLFDELRKNVALRKDQRRKDALAKQQMNHKEQTQQAKLADMGAVPPMMSGMPKPTNPEAGPNDTIPALLAPGEAVIPAKAAQKPENKPLIKALVREGRSDRNLSVPKPKGMECGTTNMKGYEYGSPEISPTEVGFHNAELSDSEGYGVLQGFEWGSPEVAPDDMGSSNRDTSNESYGVLQGYELGTEEAIALNNELGTNPDINANGWTYQTTYAVNPEGQAIPYTTAKEDAATASGAAAPVFVPPISTAGYDIEGREKPQDPVGEAIVGGVKKVGGAISNFFSPPKPPEVPTKVVKVLDPKSGEYVVDTAATEKVIAKEQLKQDHVKDVIGGVLQREGGYVANDAGKGPTNFGINQSANPDIDVKKLTKEQAAEIYKKRYYDPLVIDGMSLEAKRAVVDAGVNMGVNTAKKLWEQSGGDLNKFTDLRNARYEQIAANDPTKEKYLKGWVARSESFRPTEVPPTADTTGGRNALGETPEEQKRLSQPVPPTAEAINAGPPKTAMAPEGWMSYLSSSVKEGANSVIDTVTDPKKAVSALTSFFRDTLNVTPADAAKFATLYYGQRAMGLRKKGSIEFAGRNVLSQMDQRTQHESRMLEKGYVKDPNTGKLVPGALTDKGESKVLTFSDGTNAHKPYSFTKYEQGGTGKTVWLDNQGRTPEQVQKVDGQGRVLTAFSEADKPEARATHYKNWTKDRAETVEKVITSELGGLTDKQGNIRKERTGLYTGSEFAERGAAKLRELGYNPADPVQQNEMDNIVTNAARNMLAEKRANPDAKIKTLDHYIERNIVMAKTGIDNKLLETSKKDTYTAANKVVEQRNQIEGLIRQDNPKASASEINDKTMGLYQQFQREWTQAPDSLKKQHLSTDTESGFYLFVKDRIKEENKKRK
jgi:hypothetical protein